MIARKIIGVVFLTIAITCGILFLLKTDLNIDFQEYFDFSFKSYFSFSFFNEIIPLIICVILLYGGYLLIRKPTKSNPILALFGFTVLEEIVFSWFGLIKIDFPKYIIIIFFSCAVLALWIAYSKSINQKNLSLKEGISSLVLGTLISAFSYYL